MEKKYIVKLDDNKLAYTAIIIDGVPYIKPLQLLPYTEPDLDTIRNEAYEKGVEDTKQHWTDAPRTCAYKLGYENGLNDAWEAARKIIHMPEGDLLNIFTECYSAVCTSVQVLLKYDASEAIEKIRQYEYEEDKKGQKSITIEDVMRQYLDTFCKGRSCDGCPLKTPDFTCGRGHHFLTHQPVSDEEVRRAYAEVLQYMKER